MTTLKVEVVDLRKNVKYLKSSDVTSLLEFTNDVDAFVTSEIPPNTTRDEHMDVTTFDESEVEIDEEMIEIWEEIIYGDLSNLVEEVVQLGSIHH